MSKVFLDTNILLYSYDNSDKKKRDRCRTLLKKTVHDGNGVISTQVMQEFYSISTRKFGMDPLFAKEVLASFEQFETVIISPSLIHSAADCQILSQLSFWDALVVVAAESARCDALWTEDMNSGQVIRGVRVENPLKSK